MVGLVAVRLVVLGAAVQAVGTADGGHEQVVVEREVRIRPVVPENGGIAGTAAAAAFRIVTGDCVVHQRDVVTAIGEVRVEMPVSTRRHVLAVQPRILDVTVVPAVHARLAAVDIGAVDRDVRGTDRGLERLAVVDFGILDPDRTTVDGTDLAEHLALSHHHIRGVDLE